MRLDEFSNGIRILFNIDYEDFVGAVVDWGDYIGPSSELQDKWLAFRNDPVRFFLAADDKTQDRLWALIERRQSKRSAA